MRLLLVVTERLAVRGRDLVLSPPLPLSAVRFGRFEVELRLPDGTVARATAHAAVPRVVPAPAERRALLALLDVPLDRVPVGTEVWAAA